MPEKIEDHDASDGESENEHEYDEMDTSPDAREQKMTDASKGENGEVKKKYDPKDPLRPRRKKARRACFACQRAHLTCGDERPCQRCIKRGLAEACQDGVRKKAKYLHDAPAEALRPVLGPTYSASASTTARSNSHGQHGAPSDAVSTAANSFYSQSTAGSYPVYSTGSQTPVAETMPTFASQASPVSPSFQTQNSNGNTAALGTMPMSTVSDTMNFNALFDPSNPALFNFDLESLNFGSQYPALEFGMLGHITSGAAQTPPRDPSISGPTGQSDVNFVFNGGNSAQFGGGVYDGLVADYAASGFDAQGSLSHGLPHGLAVMAGTSGLGSPSTTDNTTASPQSTGLFDNSPNGTNYGAMAPTALVVPPRPKTKSSGLRTAHQSILGKRQRDPSSIYETVKEPYPYLTGFHNLIAFLQKRLTPNNALKIAKSLASIRPSFIACTKTLNRLDLIFMEKCFQRTLFEYEDFMQHCSAPTIVCRRTGEVAAVNKEFTALTGWTKDVLLGRAPNLNADSGMNGGNRTVLTTPRLKTVNLDQYKPNEGRPQPVFIPELLDENSVVQFYEDFAQLAFGNSRGHVNRTCRLLKYRPKTADGASQASVAASVADPTTQKDVKKSILSNRVTKIEGEHGISRIEKDGKVDCTYCWVIKRDVFDIPMLIVVNFLPCYYRNQEPQQLAV